MKPTGSNGGAANLVPFTKGDPRINRDGPVSKKLRKVRKKLERMDDEMTETLLDLLRSGDDENRRFALGFWGKYRLPVPKEGKDEAGATSTTPKFSAEVAARLARIQ